MYRGALAKLGSSLIMFIDKVTRGGRKVTGEANSVDPEPRARRTALHKRCYLIIPGVFGPFGNLAETRRSFLEMYQTNQSLEGPRQQARH